MKKLILLFFVTLLIIVLFSEYNANETQKILDAKEEEIDEKIRIAKEKIKKAKDTIPLTPLVPAKKIDSL
tara:strand:+ start:1586 stop:1795 length:210 start_codon:yes stop_codon:yes gene_type:complete